MAHLLKHKISSLGNMFDHYARAADDQKNRANKNIDSSKTHLNYNLVTHHQLSQIDFFKQRKKEVYCLNRKDVNVMCSWVVTAPGDVTEKEYKDFFKASYEFLKEKYGEENVISAYVHMDESRPHMHFAFIPVVFDVKKKRYKISAKELITKNHLKSFHSELSNAISKELGREVEILNGATAGGNKTILELKNKSLNKDFKKIKAEFVKYHKRRNDILNDLKDVELTQTEIDEIIPQKNVFGTLKGITLPDIEKLKKKALMSVKKDVEIKILLKKLNDLEIENKKLKSQLPTINEKMKRASEIRDLNIKINNLENQIEDYENIIKYISDDAMERIKAFEKERKEKLYEQELKEEDEWER